MRWICYLAIVVVIIYAVQSQGLGNRPRPKKWQKPVSVPSKLSSPPNKQRGRPPNKNKMPPPAINKKSLSQPKQPTRGGGINPARSGGNNARKSMRPGQSRQMNSGGPWNSQAFFMQNLQFRANEVPTPLQKVICSQLNKKPPVNGRLQRDGMSMFKYTAEGRQIARYSKRYGHDLDIYEALAMCHGKAIEYRGCDKTPKPKNFMAGMMPGMMPGMPGMPGASRTTQPTPLMLCNMDNPNSCGNGGMTCSQYHKDMFGIPVCCAKNEIIANQLDMWW